MTSEFEIGDRVMVIVTWFREERAGCGRILRDDGECWRIKLDKFKRPQVISKKFCYPVPRRSVVTKGAPNANVT